MAAYRFPNLLLVGAQKCGTTHIHEVLSQSTELVASKPKELNFFNRNTHTNAREIANYQRHFVAGPQRYYLESTPHYFRLPIVAQDYHGEVTKDVAQAIAASLPAERTLLAILRNPVERAVSANIHHMANGRLPYQAVLRSVEHAHGIVARGYYGQIVAHWRGVFAKQLHILMYDDLEANPLRFYRRLSSTLNIDDDFLSHMDLSTRRNSAKQRLQSGRQLRTPLVSPELVSELFNIYKEDILSLFQQEGLDYAHWLDKEALIHKLCSGQ